MAEGGSGSSPEFIYVARAEAVGPTDRVKNKIVDFIKSQRPSEHQRRTMEKFDWVGERLDGTSKELLEKLRPTAEKAAKLAGVATTTMEIALALEVAAGTALLVGVKGKDIFFDKELRNKTVDGVKGIAGKAGKEASIILRGAYAKARQAVTAALGVLGAGVAMKGIDKFVKKEKGKSEVDESEQAVPLEKQAALAYNVLSLSSLVGAKRKEQINDDLHQVGLYDSPDGSQHFAVHVDHKGNRRMIDVAYFDTSRNEAGNLSIEVVDVAVREVKTPRLEQKKRFSPDQINEMRAFWVNGLPQSITSKTSDLLNRFRTETLVSDDYDRMMAFFDNNPVLNSTRTQAWAESIRNPHV